MKAHQELETVHLLCSLLDSEKKEKIFKIQARYIQTFRQPEIQRSFESEISKQLGVEILPVV